MSVAGLKLGSIRLQCFKAQGGLCCYCRRPMWTLDMAEGPHSKGGFNQIHRLSKKELNSRVCTLEHLRERGDPLRHHADSKAAACANCNSHRHAMAWNLFAQKQQEQFKNG